MNDNPSHKLTVLVVDDAPDSLQLMNSILSPLYKVKVANNGERAIKVAQGGSPPDLILLDVMMAGLDGYDVCRRLKESEATREIPVIFLTAKSDVEDETRGFACGAVDYIVKPANAPVVLARVRAQLQLKQMSDFLRDQNQFLELEVERRTSETIAMENVTIMTMASLAETRDSDTGNHILRTQHYIKMLAEELRRQPRYAQELSDEVVDLMFKSAPLHDIGKVGIPDSILLKPGKLTPEEFEVMKRHTTIGRDAIQHAEDSLGLEVDFLKYAKEFAYTHQEKWDGSGYPEGLRGEAIPLSGRLMAIADVYDALISSRIYKDGLPHAHAVSQIVAGSGSHFDPALVEAFLRVAGQFEEIARRYADTGQVWKGPVGELP
jgi:putative two-component system response regulator